MMFHICFSFVTSAVQLCLLDTRAAEYNIQPIVLILANVGSETNV